MNINRIVYDETNLKKLIFSMSKIKFRPMKKYELIKEYPASPKLGTVVTKNGDNYITDVNTPFNMFTIELNPEFWQLMEYEILNFKYNDQIEKPSFFKKGFKGDSEWVINSVKRLIDNQIITLGNYHGGCGGEKIIAIVIDKSFTGGIKIVLDEASISLYAAHIIEKKSIGTTGDGHPIYKGDDLFVVMNNEVVGLIVHTADSDSSIINFATCFKDKGEAKKYLLRNAKVLSIEDVADIFYKDSYYHLHDALKALVKSRL